MAMRLRFPIRLKILFTFLLVVTVVVSVITFTMARLFHEDKRTYIHDLASTIALSVAEQCRSMLLHYQEHLQFYARVVSDSKLEPARKAELFRVLFEDFPELVAVSVHQGDAELSSVYDREALEAAGLAEAGLREFRRQRPLPVDRLRRGRTVVENSTIVEALPTLTLAFAHAPEVGEGREGKMSIVSGTVRLDELARLARVSRAFEVFVTDSEGTYLVHPDTRQVARSARAGFMPKMDVARGYSMGVTREYTIADVDMIGGFAGVELGDLVAGAQVPKSAAYLASRDVLKSLMGVAMVLLGVAAIVSLFWARRITRPMEDLSTATREIAKGRFDIQVQLESGDEIGTFARSFNQMVSELKRREAALQQAQAQLIQSEKMAAFGQLGAGIAHEVKNPLAGILGCAQLSLRKAEPDSPIHHNLLLIEKETKRCKAIIEGLLRFARQEKAVLSPIDIGPVVADAVAIVSHQLEMNRVGVDKDVAEGLPRIRGNANQLQQVLMNLMINAQQAMDGRPGRVRITARQLDPGWIELRVSDDGPGIPADVLGRIFEPFFTTKPGGKGTGLGLSVSYGIIKEHQGEIRVESGPGQGATFSILLPVPGADPQAVVARTA
jgi:signal transduction histidine kinase